MNLNERRYLEDLLLGGDGNSEWAKSQLNGFYDNVTKFHTDNSQSDGVNTLKRMEFEFMGESFPFALNPEEYKQDEPARITVTQTKGGAFVDDFGAGVMAIYFRGTTGFRKPMNANDRLFLENTKNDGGGNGIWAQKQLEDNLTGWLKFKELRDLIRDYYSKPKPGATISRHHDLIFHNHTDGEHWVVAPQVFSLMRSISRPLLYLYEVQLICLRSADQPITYDMEQSGGLGKTDYLDPLY